MKTISCTIRFITPAFLGDARQNGRWRTPPLKAELRHWWRIVRAAQGEDYPAIRQAEAELFGHAWLDNKATKSRVRLRLSRWQTGQTNSGDWPAVGKIQNGKASVDGGLYMGYGNVAYDRAKGTKLVHECAIGTDETAGFRIGVTAAGQQFEEIRQALALMNRYGTVGGRSRNGWGSISLESNDLPNAATAAVLMDYRKALEASWVRGIGQDGDGPLIWQAGPYKTWEAAMKQIAQIRSDLNRGVGNNAQRALLSYPVTKKDLREWKSTTRLPNTLRMRVTKNQNGYCGLLFHMPCRPSKELWEKHPMNDNQLAQFWQSIYGRLDDNSGLQRVKA